MMTSPALPLAFVVAGVLGIVIGILVANWIERRREARERAATLVEERPALPAEPDQIGTFTNLRVPVNLVVERCDAVRAAAILREHSSSPKSLPQAAE